MGKARTSDIVAFLDELLDPAGFDDYGPNGIQVPGAEEVELVATGVSAQRELFEQAEGAGASLVLCHHGLFWGSTLPMITPQLKGRLKPLFDADMALAAYHLPLDAHREVGNNALLCGLLGLEQAEPFGDHRGRAIGWVGRTADGIELAALAERCERVLGQRPLCFDSGPPLIRSIGIVSGAGTSALGEAAEKGLDAFLTGEPAEHVMADAREAGIHFLAAGHYATETLGVRRLGELLEGEFGVAHRFIDVPNPI